MPCRSSSGCRRPTRRTSIGSAAISSSPARRRSKCTLHHIPPYSAAQEDHWTGFTIGGQRFACTGPCARCTMVCVNQQTGARSNEPLAALASFRRSEVPHASVHASLTGRAGQDPLRCACESRAGVVCGPAPDLGRRAAAVWLSIFLPTGTVAAARGGLFAVDKPAGMTSFTAVRIVRRMLLRLKAIL